MKAIIVSDLHIGSRYFLMPEFKSFISHISSDCELILNGDVIDNPRRRLGPGHKAVFDLIVNRSLNHRIIWVVGNHDNGYGNSQIGNIVFKSIHDIDGRLMIAHGHDFDEIMPKNLTFIKWFKRMHNLRILLGARPIHVAAYAKKWRSFYRVLRENVMKNAALCAKENGYVVVTCGHTHYPEDRVFMGIRYINTGSWTEYPPHCITVDADKIRLVRLNRNGKIP